MEQGMIGQRQFFATDVVSDRPELRGADRLEEMLPVPLRPIVAPPRTHVVRPVPLDVRVDAARDPLELPSPLGPHHHVASEHARPDRLGHDLTRADGLFEGAVAPPGPWSHWGEARTPSSADR